MNYSAQDLSDLDAMKDLLQRALDNLTHAEDGLLTIDEAFTQIAVSITKAADLIVLRHARDVPAGAEVVA